MHAAHLFEVKRERERKFITNLNVVWIFFLNLKNDWVNECEENFELRIANYLNNINEWMNEWMNEWKWMKIYNAYKWNDSK